MNTGNQSFSGSSLLSTQNSERWNPNTIFFTDICDVNSFEELQMDTDCL